MATVDTAKVQVATKPVESFVAHDARTLYQLYLEWVKQGRPRRPYSDSAAPAVAKITTA